MSSDDIDRKLRQRIDALIQTGYRGQALMSEVFGGGGLLDMFCDNRLARSQFLKTKAGREIAAYVRAAADQQPQTAKQQALLEMAQRRAKQQGVRSTFPKYRHETMNHERHESHENKRTT